MTDPKRVKLSDFNFYHNERFRYEYDFGAGWVHEIRVEAFLEKNDKYRASCKTDDVSNIGGI